MSHRTLFDISTPGKGTRIFPDCDVPRQELTDVLPAGCLRQEPPALPEVSEVEIARHYDDLASKAFGVDSGSYPLGSCTMKYNPKVNDRVAALPGLAQIHPYQPEDTVQGALQLLWELEQFLCAIGGMEACSLQPPAGAQGEFACIRIFKAYHEHQGQPQRKQVLVPDTAHGTNPASVARCGYEVFTIKSNERGCVDLGSLRQALGPETAAVMLTNPNTLGLFETEILQIAGLVHEAGALMYCDGANMNALLGVARPGDMGFDAMHFNLHKTFSTPHGGGGPGAGPIAVKEPLAPFLPVPRVVQEGDRYRLAASKASSVGKVHGFYGNFGNLVRAYCYLRAHGADGLRAVSRTAVLNANYLMAALSAFWELPHCGPCLHEFVLSGEALARETGVRTLDVAKRLIDYGCHPPTIYFPLIVKEALMIEPTETESKRELDEFIAAMLAIWDEAHHEPDKVKTAPHTTPVGRLDEVSAARNPDLQWTRPRKV